MATAAEWPGLPPGPAWSPALQTAAWVAAPGRFMRACRARHGPRFTVHVAGEGPGIYLADPDDIGRAFTAPGTLAGAVNWQLAPVLGERSVLLLDGPEHLEQRRRMLPCFQGAPLERASAVIEDVAMRAVASWPSSGVIALRPRLQALTLEAILRVTLGVDDGPRLAALQLAVAQWLRRASSPLALVPALRREDGLVGLAGRRGPWARFVAVRAEVRALLAAEIARARAGPSSPARDDVLARLVAASDDDDEIRDQLVTLLLAGHETTATALAWALHDLTRAAPEIREAVVGEARRGEDGPWVAAVVQEALRLHPPIPVVGRQLTAPLAFADGATLPPGAVVVPCAWLVHRDPALYPDPDRFRPERFLDGGRPPGPYSWIPYGGGARRCLGARFAELEMRIVLGTVLRHLELGPAPGPREPQRWRAIVLGPAGGARVRVLGRA